jgi:hypothetical protein
VARLEDARFAAHGYREPEAVETLKLLIRSKLGAKRILVDSSLGITLLNQSLAHNLARTEALFESSEKARIGAWTEPQK